MFAKVALRNGSLGFSVGAQVIKRVEIKVGNLGWVSRPTAIAIASLRVKPAGGALR